MLRDRKRFRTSSGQEWVQLKVSVTPEFADRLDALARVYGVASTIELLRRLVADEERRLSLAPEERGSSVGDGTSPFEPPEPAAPTTS